MGDIVESHAYNFKKEIGYDLFAQCEGIAEKLYLHRSPSPRVGDKMTELDAKYYAEILHVHQQVKDEEGDEHPTALKLLALEIQNKINALAAQQEEVARCSSEQSSVDGTRDDKLRDFCPGIVGESDESQSLEDGSAEVVSTATATATATASSSNYKSANTEAAEAKEIIKEENRLVKEEIEKTDIKSLPIMQSLLSAIPEQSMVSTPHAMRPHTCPVLRITQRVYKSTASDNLEHYATLHHIHPCHSILSYTIRRPLTLCLSYYSFSHLVLLTFCWSSSQHKR